MTPQVRRTGSKGDSVITVVGPLDARTVGDLRSEVIAALAQAPRVEIDLEGVDRWSQDAIRALAACARLGPGVTFRVRGVAPTRQRRS